MTRQNHVLANMREFWIIFWSQVNNTLCKNCSQSWKLRINKILDSCFMNIQACAYATLLVCVGVASLLLPVNSVAHATTTTHTASLHKSVHSQKFPMQAQELQQHISNIVHINNIAIMPKQRAVRTKGEYVFARHSVTLLVTISGIDATVAKEIHKVTVNVNKYRVTQVNTLIKSQLVSVVTDFRCKKHRATLIGVAKVELNKEGIYDLRTVSVRIAGVSVHLPKVLLHQSNQSHSLQPLHRTNNEHAVIAQQRLRTLNSAKRKIPLRFVIIDNTAPQLSLNYDNNSASEGKYFRKNRSVRILIKDDYFVFAHLLHDTTSIAKVFADGKQVLNVTAQNFKNDSMNPEVWYMDISFARDAIWDVKYYAKDLSGNMASSRHDTFVIDTHPPEVTITGVQHGGAYAHSVTPTVIIKDRWLKTKSITYSLRRMRASQILRPSRPVKASNRGVKVQYTGFYHGKQDDDVYQLQWSAQDVVNNTVRGLLQFSMNRGGSRFTVDKSTSAMNNQQLQHAQDVHIEELNPSGLVAPAKVSIVQDGVSRILSRQDFSVNRSMQHGWHRLAYTIFRRNFADNAHYRVLIASVDKAGNYSCNENSVSKQQRKSKIYPATLQFIVDNLAPKVAVFDMRSNEVYQTPKKGKLIRISAKDNADLQSVTYSIDGKTQRTWRGKAANKPMLSLFMKPDGIAHNVLVEATDYAGNVTVLQYDNVTVMPILHKAVNRTKPIQRVTAKEVVTNHTSKESEKNDNNRTNWIINSQVQEPSRAVAYEAGSWQKESANSLATVAYCGIGVIAILCVALGISVFRNKRHKQIINN